MRRFGRALHRHDPPHRAITPDFDLQVVRDQIEAEVRRKRHCGELPEHLERALDHEFDRAPAGAAGPVGATSGNRTLLLMRAVRKAVRPLIAGARKLR